MKLEVTKSEYVMIVDAIAQKIALELCNEKPENASQYNRLLNLIGQNTKFIDEEKED